MKKAFKMGGLLVCAAFISFVFYDSKPTKSVKEIVQSNTVQSNTVQSNPNQSTIHTQEPTTQPKSTTIKQDKLINLLFIGQDTREESPRGRSDSMILISLNTGKRKVMMTSFMRDMYIPIPGYEDN